ncbi:class I SAM-dependent DNA methyltransferase [Alkalicoccobacillus porphyridii]|uniref:Uncharacterized methyltransferase FN960_00980 n=1 Tax=Alkalicoccobacillus porphyridii TaxID=2597270 RepID=A0A554A396_9BACI|nr:class I SAM-dependent methyltransferase [Alkalicoccobacillus porphyridii]TSB48162.1 methyltransferase domain-containing protein [Alkalicoccobacillus porphyridii]
MSKDFTKLFDIWSDTYDETVMGTDPQYKQAFEHYDEILHAVAEQAEGHVLEFGVGTGNLTKKLLDKGLNVTGVEPSSKMIKKAKSKLPANFRLLKGDFMQFPSVGHVDTIVSTYAFHHLTDKEKAVALQTYAELLPLNGKLVFADTIFQSAQAKKEMIEIAKKNNFDRLATDLETEFYTTSAELINMCKTAGFDFTLIPKNTFVQLLIAKKVSTDQT